MLRLGVKIERCFEGELKSTAPKSMNSGEKKYFPHSFAFDVVFPGDCRENSSLRLVDVNPYGTSTDPLLFTYLELEELSQTSSGDDSDESGDNDGDDESNSNSDTKNATLPVVRIVENPAECRGNTDRFNTMPVELVDMGTKPPDEILRMIQRVEKKQRQWVTYILAAN